MDLRWPLVLLGAVVVVLALLGWWTWRSRRARAPRTDDALLVAHVERLRSLPRFATLTKRRVVLTSVATAGALLALASSAVVAARPQESTTETETEATRDIVLCLDASGSMAAYNVEVINEFRSIVDGLQGERIGLTIFSGTAITVFPLTDDYAFVDERLDEAERAFSTEDYDFVAGTVVNPRRASLAGDGLVSCTQRFDRPEEERGRAVVLATDNEQQGDPVYSLTEAGDVAAEQDVLVYGIGTEGIEPEDGELAEMRSAVEVTGGTYATLGTDGSASSIVEEIDQLEEARTDSESVTTVRDTPGAATAFLGLGLLVLVGAWLTELGFRVAGRRS